MTEVGSTAAAPQPFTVRRVFATSFSVLGRNLLPFLIVSFVISIPYIAIQTWSDLAPDGAAGSGVRLGATYAQAITFSLVQAALAYGAFQDLRGQRAGLGTCLSRGLAASSSLIRAALLYSLLILGATLLLIVPGVVLYVMWWVYVPVIVVEGFSVRESFRRSTQLTAGRRWPIFALVALVFAVEIGLIFGAAGLLDGIVASIVTTLLAVAFTTITGVMAAVGYYYLRAEKEGVVIEDVAKVFD